MHKRQQMTLSFTAIAIVLATLTPIAVYADARSHIEKHDSTIEHQIQSHPYTVSLKVYGTTDQKAHVKPMDTRQVVERYETMVAKARYQYAVAIEHARKDKLNGTVTYKTTLKITKYTLMQKLQSYMSSLRKGTPPERVLTELKGIPYTSQDVKKVGIFRASQQSADHMAFEYDQALHLLETKHIKHAAFIFRLKNFTNKAQNFINTLNMWTEVLNHDNQEHKKQNDELHHSTHATATVTIDSTTTLSNNE
ncbi:hypothetical protein [Sulfoacidibacillus ferrooxidans]|uniref:Uncharacterized protein n=1 Tax=Sulfoacidibacillus ferrooxidans TaxID=2005001 RepID=A0A9X2AFE9_9BACL|nr:hypothetical protein [Sulfoacidibacillus ferrooxidans]MCI0183986.1 hypothetical protein [Sulfoacidibacillus ferrooxidans]